MFWGVDNVNGNSRSNGKCLAWRKKRSLRPGRPRALGYPGQKGPAEQEAFTAMSPVGREAGPCVGRVSFLFPGRSGREWQASS